MPLTCICVCVVCLEAEEEQEEEEEEARQSVVAVCSTPQSGDAGELTGPKGPTHQTTLAPYIKKKLFSHRRYASQVV